MCAFKVLVNTLNIPHGHKFTGWLGRRTQEKSFKLTIRFMTIFHYLNIYDYFAFLIQRLLLEIAKGSVPGGNCLKFHQWSQPVVEYMKTSNTGLLYVPYRRNWTE